MFKRSLSLLVPVGFAVLLLVGLQMLLDTFQVHAESQATASLALIIGTTEEINSLDPAHLGGRMEQEILYNVGSGLLAHAPGTSELVPALAIRLPEVSPNGLVYTFTLRSGLPSNSSSKKPSHPSPTW